MGSTLWGEWIHYDYQALMGESTLSLEYSFKTILKKNGDGSCIKEINDDCFTKSVSKKFHADLLENGNDSSVHFNSL